MTAVEIDTRIEELEAKLKNPGVYPTEVYTRIVGYYRSLSNWNAGKREEYGLRKTFQEDRSKIDEALAKAELRFSEEAKYDPLMKSGSGKAVSYRFYLRKTCPNCPTLKAKLPQLGFSGQFFDVDTQEGFQAAESDIITATPTLILLDAQDNELIRISSALEWDTLEVYL